MYPNNNQIHFFKQLKLLKKSVIYQRIKYFKNKLIKK